MVALCVVALAIVGVIFIQATAQNSGTETGYMVTQPVVAGAALNSANFKQVTVKPGDFVIVNQAPAGLIATHALAVSDLIRPDDVSVANEMAQVTITLSNTPTLGPGDLVDVYTEIGSQTVLLGKHLVVVSGGNSPTVSVTSADAPYWIAVISSGRTRTSIGSRIS